jgi:hypothetical protein
MGLNNLIRQPRRADKSAVGAMNRPLRGEAACYLFICKWHRMGTISEKWKEKL